ncbi:MAG: beta-ketoacyl synthase N-terminal-like domain-containing protein [Acidobacteriota bacterium]
MRRVVLAFAATVEGGGAAVRDALVDPNRLRRMDRFGRSGVLAGARALSAAGIAAAAPGAAPDPRFGVVVGTALGCRDAITQHERLLAAASRVEDLAPSVFAATVHNTVAGELAIGWGLGGPAETLVSGRTAGLEALVLAASRVAKGDADRILVVAAEGIDDAMREAFLRENPGSQLVESSAAVLLEAEEEEEEISLSKRRGAAFVEAALTFDPAPPRPGAPPIERLGATGLWEIARDLAEPRSPSKKIRIHRYAALDVHGSRCAVALEFFS